MRTDNQKAVALLRGRRVRAIREVFAVIGLCTLSFFSAIIVKDSVARREFTPLAMMNSTALAAAETAAATPVSFVSPDAVDAPAPDPLNIAYATTVPAPKMSAATPALPEGAIADTTIRYFNGRPVRPVRTIRMSVTAYSPDEASCGDSADGITSSLHNVWTNAGKLVAADSRVLPLGSMISVPGYDRGQIVPVLDRGGAIKGRRLDVLYPTHSQARRWGVQDLDVVVWEYADGKPACDFRAIRDSRN